MACTVSEQCTFRVKDDEIDLDLTYAAVVHDEDGREVLLQRGERLQVWVNPLEPGVAYVAVKGVYQGTAPVMVAGHQDDVESLKQNLGMRSKVQALEKAAIAPLLEARKAERAAAQEQNAREIEAVRNPQRSGTVAHDTDGATPLSAVSAALGQTRSAGKPIDLDDLIMN